MGVPAVSPGRRGVSGHKRSLTGKRIRAVVGATVSPVLGSQGQLQQVSGVVLRTIRVNGQKCNGLIDTGCSKTILSPQIHVEPEKIIAQKGTVLSFDGKAISHEGRRK